MNLRTKRAALPCSAESTKNAASTPLDRSSATASAMKACTLIIALVLNVSAFGALPGVTEFKTPPEKITDSQLAALLRERVAAADVIAIGETVHGSSTMLRLQTRLVRYLVSNHGLRLIVWENPALRSLELTRWLASCVKTKTPAPLDVLYMPTSGRSGIVRVAV